MIDSQTSNMDKKFGGEKRAERGARRAEGAKKIYDTVERGVKPWAEVCAQHIRQRVCERPARTFVPQALIPVCCKTYLLFCNAAPARECQVRSQVRRGSENSIYLIKKAHLEGLQLASARS